MEVVRRDDDRYAIKDLNFDGITLSTTRLEVNRATVGHTHDYQEAYYFAEGAGVLQIDEKLVDVSPGLFYLIPEGSFHKVFNKGYLPLVFVCVWRQNVK